jgi:hypothetical protein
VDDFQYAPGAAAENDGLAFAPNGTLFACGWGFVSCSTKTIIYQSEAHAIGADASGNL